MRVKLSEIIDAIEMMDQESEYFIDKETGEIVLINDFTMTSEERETACEQLDEHGFYRLPTSFDIREYDIMEDFVYSLPNPAREKLSRAIIGRGAFPSSGCIPSGNFSGETYVRYPVKYKMFHRLSSAEWAIS